MIPPAKNRKADPIHVQWQNLKRISDGNASYCPVCETGTLPMIRHNNTLELLGYDRCCYCAQIVIYDDIEYVRNTSP